jgi:hypothetical protein
MDTKTPTPSESSNSPDPNEQADRADRAELLLLLQQANSAEHAAMLLAQVRSTLEELGLRRIPRHFLEQLVNGCELLAHEIVSAIKARYGAAGIVALGVEVEESSPRIVIPRGAL